MYLHVAIDLKICPSQWQTQTGTIKKVSFTGLDAGKRYWCRVVAIGTNGQGVYSEPVSRIVQ